MQVPRFCLRVLVSIVSTTEVNVAHQDANQAWPALVAKAFGADFHNISWSGAGVVWNAGAGCSADAPFHDLYSRALGSSQKLCWNSPCFVALDIS